MDRKACKTPENFARALGKTTGISAPKSDQTTQTHSMNNITYYQTTPEETTEEEKELAEQIASYYDSNSSLDRFRVEIRVRDIVLVTRGDYVPTSKFNVRSINQVTGKMFVHFVPENN